ncbi:MAG: response regulator [Bacteroidales bacterium]
MNKENTKKILIIDDLSVNLDAVRNILNTYMPQYQVITAQSGREGIRLAREQQPEAILLDYLMPQMNGFEVCKLLKEDRQTGIIPVLMISALGDNSKVRTEGLNAGADAFISKPFDIRELVALVNVMLRIKNAEDQLRKRNEELEVFIKKQTRHYQDSEERFLQISRHAREFFWETNQEGIFTFISESAETILGWQTSEIIGKRKIWDFAGGGKHRIASLTNTFSEHEVFDDEEYEFHHKTGKKVWLTINGFPVFDGEKNFAGFRGVCDDNTRRKQAENHLRRSIEEIRVYQRRLKNLNAELTLTEEKERKRIAEYIHDGIGQTLSLAFIRLSSLLNGNLPDESGQTISKVSDLINSAILQTRSLTYDLSPPVLYEFGLIPAIRWKLEQVERKFNIKTSFKSFNNEIELKSDTTINTYRIICELIANVIKHADAAHLDVELQKNHKVYLFIVTDDGKGFDPANQENCESNGTFGLFSISERLDSMNGSILIDSAHGEGTRISISVPD